MKRSKDFRISLALKRSKDFRISLALKRSKDFRISQHRAEKETHALVLAKPPAAESMMLTVKGSKLQNRLATLAN